MQHCIDIGDAYETQYLHHIIIVAHRLRGRRRPIASICGGGQFLFLSLNKHANYAMARLARALYKTGFSDNAPLSALPRIVSYLTDT